MKPRALLLAGALAGCGHSGPFTPGDYGSDHPFAAGSPARLTYNRGDDRTPAWLPDGSAIVYSLQRLDRSDHDRCLALLPPGGGSVIREICNRDPAADGTTDAYDEPAPAPDGRLAYQRANSFPGAVVPDSAALVIASLADPLSARVLRTLPYAGADGRVRTHAYQLQWLGASSLVYVAQAATYPRPCSGCAPDTVRSGLEVARIDLANPAPQGVPNTPYASSVAAGETADVIYYTLGGDSRVYRRVLSTGADAVVHDFGAIARDVAVRGDVLVAVVGGTVSFAYDSVLGYPVQRDAGGPLYALRLSTGAVSALPTLGASYRRPAISPSGTRLVAEQVSGASVDLWLFDVP